MNARIIDFSSARTRRDAARVPAPSGEEVCISVLGFFAYYDYVHCRAQGDDAEAPRARAAAALMRSLCRRQMVQGLPPREMTIDAAHWEWVAEFCGNLIRCMNVTERHLQETP